MSDPPPPPPSGPSPGSSPTPPPPPPGLTPPPGYAAYRSGPTPTAQTSRIAGLAKATIILTGITGIGAIMTAIATPSLIDDAEDYLAGAISEDEFTDAITTFGFVQLIQSVGTLATAVLTIIWLYRVAANVRAFGRSTTWAPLWAVFGWLLPPVLIVIPFLMVREMWKASDPQAPPGTDAWKRSGENPAIWAWFLLYGIVPAILAAFSFESAIGTGLSQNADDVAESLRDSGTVQLIGSAVSVLAAISWIVVVRQVTARHTALTNER